MEAIVLDHIVHPEAQPVRAPTTAAGAGLEKDRPEPNVGRTAAFGALVGFFIASIGATVMGIAGGLGVGNALALGVCIGLWGGVGFGFMMGATVPLALYLDSNPYGHRERTLHPAE